MAAPKRQSSANSDEERRRLNAEYQQALIQSAEERLNVLAKDECALNQRQKQLSADQWRLTEYRSKVSELQQQARAARKVSAIQNDCKHRRHRHHRVTEQAERDAAALVRKATDRVDHWTNQIQVQKGKTAKLKDDAATALSQFSAATTEFNQLRQSEEKAQSALDDARSVVARAKKERQELAPRWHAILTKIQKAEREARAMFHCHALAQEERQKGREAVRSTDAARKESLQLAEDAERVLRNKRAKLSDLQRRLRDAEDQQRIRSAKSEDCASKVAAVEQQEGPQFEAIQIIMDEQNATGNQLRQEFERTKKRLSELQAAFGRVTMTVEQPVQIAMPPLEEAVSAMSLDSDGKLEGKLKSPPPPPQIGKKGKIVVDLTEDDAKQRPQAKYSDFTAQFVNNQRNRPKTDFDDMGFISDNDSVPLANDAIYYGDHIQPVHHSDPQPQARGSGSDRRRGRRQDECQGCFPAGHIEIGRDGFPIHGPPDPHRRALMAINSDKKEFVCTVSDLKRSNLYCVITTDHSERNGTILLPTGKHGRVRALLHINDVNVVASDQILATQQSRICRSYAKEWPNFFVNQQWRTSIYWEWVPGKIRATRQRKGGWRLTAKGARPEGSLFVKVAQCDPRYCEGTGCDVSDPFLSSAEFSWALLPSLKEQRNGYASWQRDYQRAQGSRY